MLRQMTTEELWASAIQHEKECNFEKVIDEINQILLISSPDSKWIANLVLSECHYQLALEDRLKFVSDPTEIKRIKDLETKNNRGYCYVLLDKYARETREDTLIEFFEFYTHSLVRKASFVHLELNKPKNITDSLLDFFRSLDSCNDSKNDLSATVIHSPDVDDDSIDSISDYIFEEQESRSDSDDSIDLSIYSSNIFISDPNVFKPNYYSTCSDYYNFRPYNPFAKSLISNAGSELIIWLLQCKKSLQMAYKISDKIFFEITRKIFNNNYPETLHFYLSREFFSMSLEMYISSKHHHTFLPQPVYLEDAKNALSKIKYAPPLEYKSLITCPARFFGTENINLYDSHGKTSLIIAVEKEDIQAVERALKKGAKYDLPRKSDNKMPLQIARELKNQKIIDRLLAVHIDKLHEQNAYPGLIFRNCNR